MHYRYTTVKEQLFHPDIGFYTSFGIQILDKNDKLLGTVCDVSHNFEPVDELTKLCTKEQLDPIHLFDVIEDFILTVDPL